MTRQEPHNCDVCGDLFYVPQDPLRTLEINRNYADSLTFDLCFDCWNDLLKWIKERREKA